MKFFLNIIFLFFSLITVSQSASEAETLFNNKQYAKAKVAYESLLKRKPNDALNNYRFARCNYELKKYDLAIKHFELAGKRFPLKDLYLGELYFYSYQFELSVAAYQNYLTTLEPDDINIAALETLIKTSELGAKLIRRVEDITIVDSILANKKDFLRWYDFNKELGTLRQTNLKSSIQKNTDLITFTTQRMDRKFYSDTINGSLNIFSSYKLLDEWTQTSEISKTINTKANENYPFLMLDGITLYFASDGENSLGGYDIFMTRYAASNQDFYKPENIGFPFNSLANDYMMVVDEQRHLGWFATDRNQPDNKVMIYKFKNNFEKKLIKNQDSSEIVLFAQLNKYKFVKEQKNQNLSLGVENNTNSEIQNKSLQSIIINDSIQYSDASEFKNPKSKQMFDALTQLEFAIKTCEDLLQKNRQKYNPKEYNEVQKQEIISMEQKYFELKKRYEYLKINTINNEILFLPKP